MASTADLSACTTWTNVLRNLPEVESETEAHQEWDANPFNQVGITTEVGAASLLVTNTAKHVVSNNIESPRMIHEEGLEKLGFSVEAFPWQEDREVAIVRELTAGGPLGSDIPFPNASVVPEQIARLRFVDCTFMVHTRPGALAREVFQEGLSACRERGFPGEWLLHHQGGSIGYQNRDYRVGPDTREIIQENQAFCWNPSLTGTNSEDTILAAARGPEMVTGPVAYPTLTMEVGGISFIRPAILEKS